MTDLTPLLDGKIALITGGVCGVGADISRLLVAHKATVIITDVLLSEGLQFAQELGERASYIYLDVADAESWEIVINSISEEHGGLDILVNNANSIHFNGSELTSIENTNLDDYMSMIKVNQVGTFLSMRSVLPLMKNRNDASIINVSSPDSLARKNGTSTYASPRWEIRGLSHTAAKELGVHGIRVNSVYPCDIDTEVNDDVRKTLKTHSSTQISDEHTDITPVANTVLFLASELSCHSTAGEYLVDGSLINNYLYGSLGTTPSHNNIADQD